MRLQAAILLLLLSLSAGCARVVILHPIEKADIFRISKGTQIGAITAEKDGYFLSDMYLQEVVQTKVK